MKILLLSLLTILQISCNSKGNRVQLAEVPDPMEKNKASQIGDYVVATFQDSKGSLWFGTLEKGVAKFDGYTLTYITTKDGLPSNRITNIIEDSTGNIWFGTGAGISKFDGKTFTNYSERDGLCSDMISNLLIDSKGNFWIGTWGGVCTFDATKFQNFQIPYPRVETQINPDTKDWITEITEDSKGNIWFGRDGYGATKFDGNSLVHFTTNEGLNSNNVQSILEDKEGSIWIGTRVAEKDNPDPDRRFGKGGLNKFDGKHFSHFPEIDGLSENDVYTIYKDKSNDLWFSTINKGVYKYSNNAFIHYDVPVSIMDILEDNKGVVWLGCAGGLYKIDKDGKTLNVTTNGPWE
ncbi:MAG: two-component regulator propeller domain-containing protein [Saprospiraceae bacterium]